jgi:pyruvate kinase
MKTVVTLGPSSESIPVLTRLLMEGADVIRLNFAHGKGEEHRRRIRDIRKTAQELKQPVAILQDLPGPKVRVAQLPAAFLELKSDEEVTLTGSGAEGPAASTIRVSYPRLAHDVKPGHAIYIADGLIRLTVRSVRAGNVLARVTNGGVVRLGNGVNMPDSSLALRAFTNQDKEHLSFGLKHGIDFVGLSFVGDENDLDMVRTFCRGRGAEPLLIAKIERRQALKNLEAIVEKSDGVMVARGDLGVEVPFSEIPGLQKHIVSTAHAKGKPVIVATQVMESMIQNPRPTRAEATDIANAVREGADAIMLSGETAVGKYPVESVQALGEVVRVTEKEFLGENRRRDMQSLNPSDIVAQEACDLAERIKAALIVVPVRSGLTAVRVSRCRPSIPVLAFVNDERMRRRLSLYWGIRTLLTPKPLPFSNAHGLVKASLLKHRLIRRGQCVVLVSGAPGLPAGETGLVQIIRH